MQKRKIEILDEDDEIEVRSRGYDFDKMGEVLVDGLKLNDETGKYSGGSFFIAEIKRGSAKYVRTELEKRIGRYVNYIHCFHTNKDYTKEEGYMFEFNPSEEVVKIIEKNESSKC
ncbi:MAG: hypothetical protein KAT65_02475 [Methanophagales archaeon]|nr:hypothetical protein [Methanophagales archaeon]